jgi:hypothetical protein
MPVDGGSQQNSEDNPEAYQSLGMAAAKPYHIASSASGIA